MSIEKDVRADVDLIKTDAERLAGDAAKDAEKLGGEAVADVKAEGALAQNAVEHPANISADVRQGVSQGEADVKELAQEAEGDVKAEEEEARADAVEIGGQVFSGTLSEKVQAIQDKQEKEGKKVEPHTSDSWANRLSR